jgi:hypothetical protein
VVSFSFTLTKNQKIMKWIILLGFILTITIGINAQNFYIKNSAQGRLTINEMQKLAAPNCGGPAYFVTNNPSPTLFSTFIGPIVLPGIGGGMQIPYLPAFPSMSFRMWNVEYFIPPNTYQLFTAPAPAFVFCNLANQVINVPIPGTSPMVYYNISVYNGTNVLIHFHN